VSSGRFKLIISPTVLAELQRAPERVRRLIADLPEDGVELIDVNDEVRRLRDGYLQAGILKPEHQADAEHIAFASVAEVDFLLRLRWNFKHIVQFEKIAGYQAINLLNGYREIRISSPNEVANDEEE
jgi:hypothetical protein